MAEPDDIGEAFVAQFSRPEHLSADPELSRAGTLSLSEAMQKPEAEIVPDDRAASAYAKHVGDLYQKRLQDVGVPVDEERRKSVEERLRNRARAHILQTLAARLNEEGYAGRGTPAYAFGRLPFGGMLEGVGRAQALKASKGAFDSDQAGGSHYLMVANELAKQRAEADKGLGGQVLDIGSALPAAVAEFMMSGGAGNLGWGAGRAGMVGVAQRAAANAAGTLLTQAPTAPLRIAATTAERMAPTPQLSDEAPQFKEGEGLGEATAKALLKDIITQGTWGATGAMHFGQKTATEALGHWLTATAAPEVIAELERVASISPEGSHTRQIIEAMQSGDEDKRRQAAQALFANFAAMGLMQAGTTSYAKLRQRGLSSEAAAKRSLTEMAQKAAEATPQTAENAPEAPQTPQAGERPSPNVPMSPEARQAALREAGLTPEAAEAHAPAAPEPAGFERGDTAALGDYAQRTMRDAIERAKPADLATPKAFYEHMVNEGMGTGADQEGMFRTPIAEEMRRRFTPEQMTEFEVKELPQIVEREAEKTRADNVRRGLTPSGHDVAPEEPREVWNETPSGPVSTPVPGPKTVAERPSAKETPPAPVEGKRAPQTMAGMSPQEVTQENIRRKQRGLPPLKPEPAKMTALAPPPTPPEKVDPYKAAGISPRDRDIVERRKAGETLEAIGKSQGIGREAVRLREKAALAKLAERESIAQQQKHEADVRAAELKDRQDLGEAKEKGTGPFTSTEDKAARRQKNAVEAWMKNPTPENEKAMLEATAKQPGAGNIAKEAERHQKEVERASGNAIRSGFAPERVAEVVSQGEAVGKAEAQRDTNPPPPTPSAEAPASAPPQAKEAERGGNGAGPVAPPELHQMLVRMAAAGNDYALKAAREELVNERHMSPAEAKAAIQAAKAEAKGLEPGKTWANITPSTKRDQAKGIAFREGLRNELGRIFEEQAPAPVAEKPLASQRITEETTPTHASVDADGNLRSSKGEILFAKSPSVPDPFAPVRKQGGSPRQAFRQGLQNIAAPIAPAEAQETGRGILREQLAKLAQRKAMAEEAVRQIQDHFDREVVAKEPAERQQRFLEFMDAMEGGQIHTLPDPLRTYADTMRKLLDDRTQQLKNRDMIDNFISNYFGHLWKDPKQTMKPEEIGKFFGGRRPLAGSEGYAKKRTIPTYREGIDAGFEPVSWNPAELLRLKLHEIDKSILLGHDLPKELQANGLRQFVKLGGKVPDGFTKVNDPNWTVYAPPEVKVNEYFDAKQMQGLMDMANGLGVDVQRVSKLRTAGQQLPGEIKVAFASPESVLAHEIGHEIDQQYDIGNRLRNNPAANAELSDLAKMRHDAIQASPEFKKYVQQGSEKMAALVEAYIHAPELLEKVAPSALDMFERYIEKRPELKGLADVKPSLVLGKRQQVIGTAGPQLIGHYYAPEPVATDINNHLSQGLRGNKAFDVYRGAANLMNQAQLGLSAFHAGFVFMDTQASAAALGMQLLSRGEFRKAAGALLGGAVPGVSFVKSLIGGSKLLKEYYKPGSQGAEMAEMLDGFLKAGGRVKMDDFYSNDHLTQLRRAINQVRGGDLKKIGGALFHALPALQEAISKPVMEVMVPRAKAGVFLDMARAELDRLGPNATDVQKRAALGKAWDSVENRLGEMTYDNLFWKRSVKDLLMASVRSVGWNLGTARELGGGIKDIPASARGIASGQGISPRTAYIAGMVMTAGLYGAMAGYLMGQKPEDMKDLFFPRTGRKRKDGSDERLMLPSYMKEVAAISNRGDEGPLRWLKNVGTMAKHKIHPALALAGEFLENEDWQGKAIYDFRDPHMQQAKDVAEHVLGAFQPFAFRQYADDKSTLGEKAAGFFGITKAPAYITRTNEQQRAMEEEQKVKVTPLARKRK